MPKNIVIFSDGTGQVGGLRPEQRLSNIYKVYRACRVDPVNNIDPADQIAFYDPGLGTDEDAGGFLKWWRSARKLLGSATGRGIGHNIADCYEFIINHWEAGDRIWIFGFSRGAYTARCVANVLSLCGVPTKNADGAPLDRLRRSARQIANEAVHRVYEHGAGYPLKEYELERDELARRFREKYGSADGDLSNANPYFIGVFDTVAALGAKGMKRVGIFTAIGLAILAVSALPAFAISLAWGVNWLLATLAIALVAGAVLLLDLRRKSRRSIEDFPKPGDHTAHHIRWKADNYDRSLSHHVRYARHAISIDERRADFPRVKWGRADVIRPKESPEDEPLIQLWFAGNHSDIGGSYPETESRLSDVALQWMIEEATSPNILHRLCVDQSKLNLFPSAAGMQHCEIQGFANKFPWLSKRLNWPVKSRKGVLGATLHSSVSERFNLSTVSQCGRLMAYRPETLREDERFKHLYP